MEIYVVEFKDLNNGSKNKIHLFKSEEGAYKDFNDLKTKAYKEYGVKDLLFENNFSITTTSRYVSFYTKDFRIDVEIRVHIEDVKD